MNFFIQIFDDRTVIEKEEEITIVTCITSSGYFQIEVSHETRSVECNA